MDSILMRSFSKGVKILEIYQLWSVKFIQYFKVLLLTFQLTDNRCPSGKTRNSPPVAVSFHVITRPINSRDSSFFLSISAIDGHDASIACCQLNSSLSPRGMYEI